jgi:hypothetical protein
MDLTIAVTSRTSVHEKQEFTMPAKSSQPAKPSPPTPATGPPTAAQKSAATVMRHKEERRAESLNEIRQQTADGTLFIR